MAVSPFVTGHGIVLQTAESTPDSSKYLDSNVNTTQKSASVYLSDARHVGSYWNIVVLSNNRIRLNNVIPLINKRFLDSSGAAHRSIQVYLEYHTAGDGSHWLPTRFNDGNYSFKSDTPSGTERYLCADQSASKEYSVYLAETSESPDTRWSILLTHYIGESVQSIISAVYPSVLISSYETSATYGSLEYDHLYGIWKETQLGDNQITPNACDFAVCLKAEVYKYSYDADSPWPDDKGSICGIMWGSIGGNTLALNFTIDPFQKLILFDPQNGQQIANDKFTPTFCMV